jgi:hypothetical protein
MTEQEIPTSSTDPRLVALAAVPGVLQALAGSDGDSVFLLCDSEEQEAPLLMRAREALRSAGHDAAGASLQIAYLAPPQPARRARFVGLEISRPAPGETAAEVTLEWEGQLYVGQAEGEASAPGEMRTCGNATLRALEEVISGSARFTLLGIKATRIFDTDLVAVLLTPEDARDQGLIGASLVTDEVHRAAALAVLNATNRYLGNFLNTPD